MEGALKAGVPEVGPAPSAGDAPARETHVFTVPEIMCGGCLKTIETALSETTGVSNARANLSARRVTVTFDPSETSPELVIAAIKAAGFSAAPLIEGQDEVHAARVSELMPRVGVAGFAAANIMLLSVSVWSGHASDMDDAMKSLFHWISALIALPAIAYAGQPFFKSALAALKAGRLNMDVPISLGIILATAMSFVQTMRGTDQVYFDAATMLVFFLLIGRLLDESMRARTRSAAENLMSLKALTATILDQDGSVRQIPSRNLHPGMTMLVATGERIAADGIISEGVSEIDESLITGETLPKVVSRGDRVHAGTLNTAAPLRVTTTATEDNTLLAELSRLMLAGEQTRGRYVRLADRAARLYAPAVHLLGLSTLIGWLVTGHGWEIALTNAIAVLIITCPCALALAVPAVQVAAISRLFGLGVLVKAADGLERLSEIDTIIFDKTGTLTLGEPSLAVDQPIDADVLASAAALAVMSRHPYAQAMVRAARVRGISFEPRAGVTEIPGSGLSVATAEGEERLGSAIFAGVTVTDPRQAASLWYARPGRAPIGFRFEDRLRSDAPAAIAELKAAGYHIEILSGDRPDAVADAASALGVRDYKGGVRPEEKLARLADLKKQGRLALMVGDGLNDAPALAAGHASMSPSAAADISQNAADAVFQGEKLGPVVETLKVARRSHRMALENFAIAILYNIAFVPMAVLGYVTPLLAAIAMSTSSILVTGNALRLRTTRLKLDRVQNKQG
ncbi:MAG: cadmium-translocating P-type ATPase [Hyphomicrobium sp.]|jgi:Cu2+-exporting ATPase|nr:cadmium-translocating P-type ATPase [Hyphomicrobium sp.]